MGFFDRFVPFVSAALLLFVTIMASVEAAGPWCFACTDASHPAICQYVVQCGDHEACSTKKVLNHNGGEFYSTTCKDTKICQTKVRAIRRVTVCDECCTGTLCNEAGCNSTGLRAPGRLYCLKCDFVKNPAFCDQVELCSADEYCSVSHERKLGQEFYRLGCRSKTSCPPPTATIAKDRSICCDNDLCNSNDLGQNPSLYTTTPIPTTRKPADPQVSFDNTHLTYNVTHVSNEELQLLCHVTGGPIPTVEWTYNNGTLTVPIKTGISIEPNGDSRLSIPTPDKSDSGNYTCKATNSRGNAEKAIEVTVLDPPEIKGNLNNSLTLQYQEDVTLECNVTMDNNTKVSWVVPPNVKSYTIHPDNSLTLHNAHSENTGDYLCVAENADGKTIKSYSVDVNDTSTQTTPQICSCPTVTIPTCPVVTKTSCPQVTCPTVTSTPCPKVTTTPCPTMPPTPTNQGISTTLTTTLKQTPPTTSKTSTSTSTTSATTSSSSTTTTSTSSTPITSAQTTTTSSSTTQSNQINTLPTANILPSSPFSSTPPSGPQVNDQFQSEKRYLNILQCPVTSTNKGQVSWHRLVQDFDHGNPAYIDNGFGILTISNQMSVLTTGVYECRVGNTQVAQFVVYEDLANSVKCNDAFGSVTSTEGVVIRAKCGACPNPLGVRPSLQLKLSDYICESAIAKQLIKAYGGDVTYLIKSPNEVVMLNENGGRILVP